MSKCVNCNGLPCKCNPCLCKPGMCSCVASGKCLQSRAKASGLCCSGKKCNK